jgi:hypothetical protein
MHKLPATSSATAEQIEVLIYNGNLDVIVHVPGMNRVVNSLVWRRMDEFNRKGRKKFWTWNDDLRNERQSTRPSVAGGGRDK